MNVDPTRIAKVARAYASAVMETGAQDVALSLVYDGAQGTRIMAPDVDTEQPPPWFDEAKALLTKHGIDLKATP